VVGRLRAVLVPPSERALLPCDGRWYPPVGVLEVGPGAEELLIARILFDRVLVLRRGRGNPVLLPVSRADHEALEMDRPGVGELIRLRLKGRYARGVVTVTRLQCVIPGLEGLLLSR